MGISRHYIREENFVLTLVRDISDNRMLEEHVRILTLESKDMHPLLELADASELHDLSGFSEIGMASSAFKEIERESNKKDLLAILVSNDEAYDLAFMYATFSHYFRNQVKVFKDYMSAVKWLGMENHATEIDKLRKQ